MEVDARQVDDNSIELNVRIAFGMHDFRTNWPVVRFAINGGEIRLDLEGVKFAHSDDAPEMPVSVNRKITTSSGDERSVTTRNAAKGGGKAATSWELTTNTEHERQDSRKRSATYGEESSYAVAQVQPLLGSRPGWRFHNEARTPYLKGTILKQLHGSGTIVGDEVRITATFNVRESDILIEADDIFLRIPASSKIKHRLARRAFFNRLIKECGNEYLSKAVLIHEQ